MIKKICLIFVLASFVSGYSISDEKFFHIRRALRRIYAHTDKSSVADFDEQKSLSKQSSNGDEKLYEDLRGSFSKSLQHLPSGFVDRAAFESLRYALGTGKPSDFNKILIGLGIRKLVNPQASLAYTLMGNDCWINPIRPAPTFASAETAGEMVELYWTVLVRDVPFNDFDTNATALAAIAELNTLSDFRGPKIGGVVTPVTFLRGNTPGDLTGPYISQFLYQTIPYGNTTIPPEQKVPLPGVANDFMTTFTDWFTVESGGDTGASIMHDPVPRFIRTARDLSEYVHVDSPGQSALSALFFLNNLGPTALDPNNPYLSNPTQDGFVTFGFSEILELTRAAIQEGLKAAWYQKWQVNRRLRPEEFGFYVQQQVANGINLGIHPDLITASVLGEIFTAFSSYFLPQAYPEGSPTHPSYPAGHAVLMGAAVTILKAMFNEAFVIPSPLEPNAANTVLVPFGGALTVGGELNKLASNIALGRDHGGVHYRSDGIDGLLLGEEVAIDILENEAFLFNEDFSGFSLTKFDGTTIQVGAKRTGT
ncbi:MAG: hypothetical protein KR126chlam1_00765 [Chlamydiae bacterium]|nr:hypothetical protein [Chlamydiota bacterium]